MGIAVACPSTIGVQPFKANRFYVSKQYALPADEEEQRRLQTQHDMLIETLDSKLIYPDVNIKDGDHILDNATGTAIWACEASAKFPNATIDAVDMSTRLWPGASPTNVHLLQASILALPAEWTGRFAFAHQRLLMVALTRSEWRSAISELFRVTAPGGCVQLGEFGTAYAAGPAERAHRAVRTALYEARGLFAECADHLAEMLCDAGFERVTELRKRVLLGSRGGPLGRAMAQNILDVFLAMKAPMVATGAVSSEDEAVKLTHAMVDEFETMDCYITYSIFWGYKPR